MRGVWEKGSNTARSFSCCWGMIDRTEGGRECNMVVLNGTPVGFLNKADVGTSPFKNQTHFWGEALVNGS